MMNFKNKKFAIAVSIFCMLLWGSAVPLIKMTYRALGLGGSDVGPKILVAGIRFFMAGLLGIFYFILLRRRTGKAGEKIHLDVRYILILSLLQTSVQYLFYYIGLANTMGVKAAVIQAANSFFVVIFSALMIKNDRITGQRIAALLIGTAGILVVNLGGAADFSFHLAGEGAVLMATMFNAVATVYVRKYGQNQDAFLASGVQFLIGSIPLIVIGLIFSRVRLQFTPQAFLMLLYGGFVSATAFGLWSMVLHEQSSGEFGAYKLFIPIFGSMLSVLLLGERFTPNLAVGMVLVLAGLLVLNKKKKS